MSVTIEDLPHAVIEYIFSYLSPYRDLKQCMLVNKSWYELVQTAIKKIQRDFHFAVTARNVCWHHCHADSGPTISRRYSHSACICGNSMYVFGGCTTASTTFNDLWRLDLATRCWIRPLATGTYPPPKACASMVCYRDNLILLGGWTHTSPYPLHQIVNILNGALHLPTREGVVLQAWHIFNHLHIYNTNTNRWNHVVTSSTFPGMAGHTASILGDRMVVFGGLHCQSGWGPFSSSNDIWVLDLKCMSWRKQSVTSPIPHPRYGHSQITIDENHIMIVGGCGGPNMLFSDIWLLTLHTDPNVPWEWKEMEIRQKSNAAPHLTFHPACKVGSKVVVLSKARWSRMSPACFSQLLRAPSRTWIPPCAPQVFARPEPRPIISQNSEKENCVNGKKGVLKRHLNRSLQKQRVGNNTSSSDDDDMQANSMKKGVPIPRVNAQELHNLSQPSTSREGSCESSKSSDTTIDCATNNTNLSTFSPSSEKITNSKTHFSQCPSVSGSRLTLSVRPNAWRNRQRQLEGLDRMEQRLRSLRSGIPSVSRNGNQEPSTLSCSPRDASSSGSSNSSSPKNPLCLYVLDINLAILEGHVSWTAPQQQPSSQGTSGLEEVILYTLLLGRRELVMFGGIQKDLNSYQNDGEKVPQIVSNSLHFISGLRYVI